MEDFEIHVLGCTLISTVVLDASDLQSGKFPVVAEGHQWWLEAWASWRCQGDYYHGLARLQALTGIMVIE